MAPTSGVRGNTVEMCHLIERVAEEMRGGAAQPVAVHSAAAGGKEGWGKDAGRIGERRGGDGRWKRIRS